MFDLKLPRVVDPEIFTDAKPISKWLPILGEDFETLCYIREHEDHTVAMYVRGESYVEYRATNLLN